GIVGFKPSFGLIPRAGVKPLADSLDTVGVMARDVADAAFFAAALSDRPELRVAEAPPPRILLYHAPEWPQADAATHAAIERAAERLRRTGAGVAEKPASPEHEGLVAAQKTIM